MLYNKSQHAVTQVKVRYLTCKELYYLLNKSDWFDKLFSIYWIFIVVPWIIYMNMVSWAIKILYGVLYIFTDALHSMCKGTWCFPPHPWGHKNFGERFSDGGGLQILVKLVVVVVGLEYIMNKLRLSQGSTQAASYFKFKLISDLNCHSKKLSGIRGVG